MEILSGTEPLIELSMVLNPVAMIGVAVGSTGTLVILIDGTDPDWSGYVRKGSG